MSIFDDMLSRTISDAYKDTTITQEIIVYHRTTTTCDCGSQDSLYGMSFNQSCATCEGRGYYYTSSKKNINCVVNNFLGGKTYYDETSHLIGVRPDDEIRLTCMLKNALVNIASVTGATYFDDADKVKVGKSFFQPRNIKKVEYGNTYYLQVTLNEVKRDE